MSRHKLFHTFTWLVALGLVAWTLSRLPLASITRSVASLSAWQWCGWILLNLFIIELFVQRWRVLVQAQGESIGFIPLLLVRQAGQAVSFATPGPQFGGEPLQVYWLWNRYAFPGHAAVLAVGLDRFFELWINFAILLLSVVLLLLSRGTGFADWRELALMLLVILLLLSAAGWFLLRHSDRVAGWIRRLGSRWHQHPDLGRLDTHWNRLSDSLQILVARHKPALLRAFGLSLCGWLGMLAELWLLLAYAGVAPTVTEYLLVLVAMRLAFLLPLPGGIGTLEAAMLWAFHGLGFPATAAAALIALMRLRDAVILIAGLGAWRGLRTAAAG